MAEYVFKVNGITRSTSEDKPLLRYLRDDLNLKSVKDGCSEGACGTCTIIVDGKATRSCICLEYPIFILSPSSIMSRMLYNIRDRISTGFAILIYIISKQSAHNQTAAMPMLLCGIICPAPVEAMQ